MAAVKAGDVDRALRSRRPETFLLLFYGPDAGRVTERARAAAETGLLDPSDPFQLVRLDGDAVADEPGRLVEEASTFGLFGNRRNLWVRSTNRSLAPAVTACLATAIVDCLVVVEAGDLSRTAPLRVACEASDRALAMPCYADEARDLASVVTETLQAEGLTIDAEARSILVDSLGGDRLASRGEVEKLALYAAGRDRVTVEDVLAVVSDVSAVSLDAALDAAFRGQLSELDANLRQLGHHGVAAGTLLSGALRHSLALLSARAAIDQGQDAEGALRGWRGLHFRRRATVETQLRLWTSRSLRASTAALQQAVLDGRMSPQLAWDLAGTALFRIARAATRESRAG